MWFLASVDAREGLKPDGRRRPPPRTWGYFASREDAVSYIHEHVVLLTEGRYYTHAVVEAVRCGVGHFGGVREAHWFKLHSKERIPLGERGSDYVEPGPGDDTATPCEKPKSLGGIVNFTL